MCACAAKVFSACGSGWEGMLKRAESAIAMAGTATESPAEHKSATQAIFSTPAREKISAGSVHHPISDSPAVVGFAPHSTARCSGDYDSWGAKTPQLHSGDVARAPRRWSRRGRSILRFVGRAIDYDAIRLAVHCESKPLFKHCEERLSPLRARRKSATDR